MEKLNIEGRLIGPGEPPYVIAEIGSNHNGDMDLARRLVDAAVEAGADCAKFQSWSKRSLICKAEYERNTEYADTHRHFGTLEQMCAKYQFTETQHREMADYCRERGITFISTPFSAHEADLLEGLDVPFFKIASMDVPNLPLLEHIGAKGRPVMLSTGMSTVGEVERAVAVLREAGSGPVCVLHCIAVYPPRYADINLLNIPMFQDVFDVPVGFSDHSRGTAIPLASVAVGACVVEKHFTLDKDMKGWDHWVSADPADMAEIVREGRNIALALGGRRRVLCADEQAKKLAFRRSAVAARPLTKGAVLAMDDLDFKRPGTGIGPDEAAYLVGRTLARDLAEDEEMQWNDLL
ncbi:N-acetylneuraminate synthase family protein [Desulfocurvus sp. DL9XJH121]